MVWGGIIALGKTELALISTTLNADRYTVRLQDYLLPFSCCTQDDELIFMHYNVSIHTAGVMKEWMTETYTTVMQ